MTKIAVVLLADAETHEAMGRAANAFELVKEAKQADNDVELILDGAGTRWAKELAKEGEDRSSDLGSSDRSCPSVFREDVVQVRPPHPEVLERRQLLTPLHVIVERSHDRTRLHQIVVADHHDLLPRPPLGVAW